MAADRHEPEDTDGTTRHETRIELDDRVPLVRIVREFDAPPSKV